MTAKWKFRFVAPVAGFITLILAGSTTGALSTASAERAPDGAHHITHNTCKRSKIDVPACGVLWGLYQPAGPSSTSPQWVQHYADVEQAIGRRFDIVKEYEDWRAGATFPNSQQASLATGGRVLEFSWNAANYKTRTKVSYESIADGQWDNSVILPEATRLKNFHHKVFIDFDHEFDNSAQSGKGTSAQYVAAYRHIHQVLRQAGVKNVIWTWLSTGFPGHAQQITDSYPGRGYVDWVGYDPYNFAGCHSEGWRSPYQTFVPFYRWLRAQPNMRNKPIMLGEYASAPGASVGSWYAHVARALRYLPKIKAVIQWSSSVSSPPCDFRLTDSAAALAGFAKSANAPYITGTSG
jgi:hypothetical protein